MGFIVALEAPEVVAVEPPEVMESTLPVPDDYDPAARLVLTDLADGAKITQIPESLVLYVRTGEFPLQRSSVELFINGVEYTEQLDFYLDRAELPGLQQIMKSSAEYEITARVRDEAGTYFDISHLIEVLPIPCPFGCAWPFVDTAEPDVVSNLMEDFQSFGSPHYWHKGLDIRVPVGTAVHAVNSGTVVKIANYHPGDLYWSVGIQDASGVVWQYHHMDPDSITVNETDVVSAGDPLGEVIAWSASMNGFTYHHLHLNAARWDGGGPIPEPYVDGWTYFNPLLFLTKGSYVENVLPTQFDVYYADNESTTAFASDADPGTPVLQGDVDVLARLRDRRATIAPAMGQPYELGIYNLSYRIVALETPCGVGSKPRTWLGIFNRIPGGSSKSAQTAKLHEIYEDQFTFGGSQVGADFDYSNQELLYTLTNTKNGVPNGPNGMWNTDALAGWMGGVHPDGLYAFVIYARDIDGNQITSPFTVELDNGLGYNGFCPGPIPVDGPKWVPPLDIVSAAGGAPVSIPPPPPPPVKFNEVDEDGVARANLTSDEWPVWSFDLPAVGQTVHIGMLTGQSATVEFHPLLGDVIVEAQVEVQSEQIGGQVAGGGALGFDPDADSTQPLSLRYSTRLARDPITGEALIGTPMNQAGEFMLVMAAEIDVIGRAFIIKTPAAGIQASFEIGPEIPLLSFPVGLILAASLLTSMVGWRWRQRTQTRDE